MDLDEEEYEVIARAVYAAQEAYKKTIKSYGYEVCYFKMDIKIRHFSLDDMLISTITYEDNE